MADVEPAVLTPETTAVPETASPERAAAAEQSERVSRFMNRLMRSGTGRGTPPDAALPTDTPDASPTESTDEAKSDATPDAPITLTKTELDRQIQAEVDRRETVRKQREQARAAREARKTLLRSDPLAAAETTLAEMDQQEAAQSDQERLLGIGQALTATYDRTVLDPLFAELPADAQSKLLKDHAHLSGMDQRAALAKASVAALIRHAKAQGFKEADAKLRTNPAFAKQMVAQWRDESDEPESVPAARPTATVTPNMDTWMRRAAGR